ncbi:glycosyltransferase [Stenotrophomonas sp. PS02289]|uniref:glycosyltransferase n=1 Tax=Stenotrophomonas sp. PS02289 TaxID=2991422 RepID=UPI00249AA822|nr:glycosyltransferase [Stenotrophomonas sp. PS02289]
MTTPDTSNTPTSSIADMDAEQRGKWLLETLTPTTVIRAARASSPVFSSLIKWAETRRISILDVQHPTSLGEHYPGRWMMMLDANTVADSWQLMDWVKRLGADGVLVLHGIPPRDCPVPMATLGDGLHWLIGSALPSSMLDKPVAAVEVPALPDDLTLDDAIALLQEERLRLAQVELNADRQRAAYEQAAELLMKAERRIIALRRTGQTSAVGHQATQSNLRAAQAQISALLASRSWRITAPLRITTIAVRRIRNLVMRMLQMARTTARITREQGVRQAGRRILEQLRNPASLLSSVQPGRSWKLKPTHALPAATAATESLEQRVLLVAELGLAQCLKYRVLQKQQMIRELGVDCTIVNWTDTVSTRSLLNTHSVAIFYRVPGYPDQLETIALAKKLGVRTFWEVDDLIFDREHYLNNSNIHDLSPQLKKGLLAGVPLYRQAMLACGECISSTIALADAMKQVGVERTWVVENALDVETLEAAEEIEAAPPRGDGLVRIVYGSGSKAHDADFKAAAAGILAVLKKRYDARLTIIGHLNLPPEFKAFDAQVERLPPSDYSTYMKRLAKCQVNIAPLEDTVFNDAKSNIKYLEAAILGIPSVCSPTIEYRETITHGVTGMLATTPKEWEEHLLALLGNPTMRREIGERARLHVMEDYTPHAIAERRMQPLLTDALPPVKRSRPRVLGVNIFFEPRSFGGATIVAEQMARLINANGDLEYGMFTSLPITDVHAYKVTRYRSSAAEVFAIGLPHESDPVNQFDNPYAVIGFREVLRSWRPDVVHIHSIQGIGIQIAEACQDEGIPFVVTLHDAWWICDRQFMVNNEGRYCYQRKVDLDVCSRCVPNPAMNPYRQHRLHEVLTGAALMLSPSQFFMGIYADNGFDPGRLVVNKNGIVPPRTENRRSPPSQRPIRFGFVGGEGPIKGSNLIKKALRELPQHVNYELRVVDNELNLGRQSIFEENWKVPGTFKTVPAYNQENIDDFFGNIDVLLFPTQWKESFGLSVREALIRDVWVIATDAGGVIEDIVDGENGNVIPLNDDGTELRKALERLLDNPAQLDGYRNPHVDMVRLFQEQALELTGYLQDVISRHPVQWRAPLM